MYSSSKHSVDPSIFSTLKALHRVFFIFFYFLLFPSISSHFLFQFFVRTGTIDQEVTRMSVSRAM